MSARSIAWPEVALGEVCEFKYGKSLPASKRAGGNVAVYGSNGVIGQHNKAITDGLTIVVGRKGSFGAVNLSHAPCWPIDTTYYIDRTATNADLRWLAYQLTALGLTDLNKAAAVPGLNREDAYRKRLLLPPLAEQRRIAAILDQAGALRAKRRHALAQLNALTQSLFLDLFGDPVTNPQHWPTAQLGDVIYSATDGPHVSPAYADEGVPFVSARHIRRGEILWTDLKFISAEDALVHWRKCKPERDDILYTKGGTTGIAKVIDFDQQIALWVHVALLKTNRDKVDPLWLENMLNSDFCYLQSQRLTHGIANRDLGLKRMVRIQLYLPPLLLQREFAAQVSVVQRLKSVQRTSLAKLDTLFASLQQRAFRGEL